jgi:hypothetical protein
METLPKTETEIVKVKYDFRPLLEYIWEPGAAYDAADYVRPTAANGFEYECTTGGQSGSREPRWPTTVAATVTDGSITWTARAFGTNATDTLSNVNLEASDDLTLGTPNIDGSRVTFTVSGGDLGGCYVVSIEGTTSAGEVLEEKLQVQITGV